MDRRHEGWHVSIILSLDTYICFQKRLIKNVFLNLDVCIFQIQVAVVQRQGAVVLIDRAVQALQVKTY